MPIDLWIVEVKHTHTQISVLHDDCEYRECPGVGWIRMAELWWHDELASDYNKESDKELMNPRPLEECIARCYDRRDFISRHSSYGTTYRIRNLETEEIIPVEALGV